MNYTDDQLKQLLAKMLPETVNLELIPTPTLEYKNGRIVLDTELLHLCSLAEARLTAVDRARYIELLEKICTYDICFATWQQRTRALAEVKGVAL